MRAAACSASPDFTYEEAIFTTVDQPARTAWVLDRNAPRSGAGGTHISSFGSATLGVWAS